MAAAWHRLISMLAASCNKSSANPARARFLDTTQLARALPSASSCCVWAKRRHSWDWATSFRPTFVHCHAGQLLPAMVQGRRRAQFPAPSASGHAQVVASIDAIYHFHRRRRSSNLYVVNEMRGASIAAIRCFGHTGDWQRRAGCSPHPIHPSNGSCSTRVRSASVCPACANAGMRIAHNQLLAVCSGDAAAPSVGMVRWLGLSEDDILSAGMRCCRAGKAVPMRAWAESDRQR